MIVLVLALSLGGTGQARAAFGFLTAWGAPGAAPGQFATPDGISVDARGHVYVADRDNNRIQVFSASGRFLAQIGTGELAAPYGVSVDGWGDVLVADTHHNRIVKFSPAGRVLARWGAHGGDGTAGAGNGEFNDPRGVAVDDAGDVYVADHNNNRVQKLSRSGRFLARWGANGGDGTLGAGNGEFSAPRGVAVDHAGDVFVADKRNNRIQELSASGAFIRRWGANGGDGTAGAAAGEFNLPYSIAIDAADHLFVADVANNRVQEFTATGAFVARFGHAGGDGTPGTGPGEFEDPYGVAVDCRSNLYVTDEGNARVQKFGAAGPAPRCAPVLTVRPGAAATVVARRGLAVSVRCDRPCDATVTGRVSGAGRGTMRARSARRALLPGRTVRLRLALGADEARAIARARRAGARPRMRVTVTASGLGGRAHAVRRSVTL